MAEEARAAPLTLRISERVVLRKFDGEGTEGKEPVEEIIVHEGHATLPAEAPGTKEG